MAFCQLLLLRFPFSFSLLEKLTHCGVVMLSVTDLNQKMEALDWSRSNSWMPHNVATLYELGFYTKSLRLMNTQDSAKIDLD